MDHVLSDDMWKKLEELLNHVANEREQDDEGPGSDPTGNAHAAFNMIKELKMERRKPSYII